MTTASDTHPHPTTFPRLTDRAVGPLVDDAAYGVWTATGCLLTTAYAAVGAYPGDPDDVVSFDAWIVAVIAATVPGMPPLCPTHPDPPDV